MALLRSRRLEVLFGGNLEQVTAAHIDALVTEQVSESNDLDFKAELYGGTDGAKKSLASDVAAMANSAGGIIVLGVAEDGEARASAAPGVDASDAQRARIRQIVAAGVSPMPQFDVISVHDEPPSARGFILIAVPRSVLAPHAVLVNESLRFPTRNGATTRHLSEPEVTAAYRGRFAAQAEQAGRLDQVEAEMLRRLINRDDNPWLVVSLVPDLPGEFAIDQASFAAFDAAIRGGGNLPLNNARFYRVDLGHNRLVADDANISGNDAPHYLAVHLETDGSGVAAIAMPNLGRAWTTGPDVPGVTTVSDVSVAAGILDLLQLLSHHSAERTHASGMARVRVSLLPPVNGPIMQLGSVLNGNPTAMGRTLDTPPVPVETFASLDDLAEGGSGLVAAAARLQRAMGHQFGIPELPQMTLEGQLVGPSWGHNRGDAVDRWAAARHVEILAKPPSA